ncbi:MAG: hypothetical protein JHC77_02955 [Opitutales bacterium]|jgi:hypothetical protein|nr:hypothetical protein [Opitutales bacterium]
MKTPYPLLVLFSLFFITGCQTTEPSHFASIYVEAPESSSRIMRKNVTLPVSGITIPILGKELTLAEDLLNTEVVETGEPDLRVVSLLVQLNRTAAAMIMDVTRQARGKHLVLVINDEAVGIMPIEDRVVDGNLFFFVERKGKNGKEAALEISRELNRSILLIRQLEDKK